MATPDSELWGLAKKRQASTALARSQFFRSNINGLCDRFAPRLNELHLFGLDLTWSCEFFFGGSTGNNVAVVQPGGEFNDLDLLLVMTPTSTDPNTNVSVGLQRGSGSKFNNCCLEVTWFGALTRRVLNDTALGDVWAAFRLAVTEFINHHGFVEKDIALKDDGTARQMRCSFTINDIPIDVLPALKTSSDIHLILRRKVDVDGSNIVRSFGIMTARKIGGLHPKASWMICVLKHIAKIVRRIDAPGCLFEAVVLEIFGRNGWIKGYDDESIRFSQAWHDCWEMIESAKSISPPGAAADEGENLFSRMGDNEHRFRDLARAMTSLDPKDLEEMLQDTANAPSMSLLAFSGGLQDQSLSAEGVSQSPPLSEKAKHLICANYQPSSSRACEESSAQPVLGGSPNLQSTTETLSDSYKLLDSGTAATALSPLNIEQLVEISEMLNLNESLDITSLRKTILLQPSYIGDSALVSMLVTHEEPYRTSVLPWKNVLSPALPCELFAALRIEYLCVRDLLLRNIANDLYGVNISIISAGNWSIPRPSKKTYPRSSADRRHSTHLARYEAYPLQYLIYHNLTLLSMQDTVRDVILPAVLAPLECLSASKTNLPEYTKRFDEFIAAASRLSCCLQEVSRYIAHRAWRKLVVDPNKQQLLSMISGEVLNLLQHFYNSKAEIINRAIDSILCGTSSCGQVSNGSIKCTDFHWATQTPS